MNINLINLGNNSACTKWGSHTEWLAQTPILGVLPHIFTEMSSHVQKLPFPSHGNPNIPENVLRRQSTSHAETHPGVQKHHHHPPGEFCRRVVPPVQTYRRFAFRQYWRKRQRPKLRGVLAAISRDEIATDGRDRFRKNNGVRRFETVRPSALNFSFYALTSRFWEITMHPIQNESWLQLRPGRRGPFVVMARRAKTGRLGKRRPTVVSSERGGGATAAIFESGAGRALDRGGR